MLGYEPSSCYTFNGGMYSLLQALPQQTHSSALRPCDIFAEKLYQNDMLQTKSGVRSLLDDTSSAMAIAQTTQHLRVLHPIDLVTGVDNPTPGGRSPRVGSWQPVLLLSPVALVPKNVPNNAGDFTHPTTLVILLAFVSYLLRSSLLSVCTLGPENHKTEILSGHMVNQSNPKALNI